MKNPGELKFFKLWFNLLEEKFPQNTKQFPLWTRFKIQADKNQN